jgi:hypothetical protein
LIAPVTGAVLASVVLLGWTGVAGAAVNQLRSDQHVVICHALGNGGWVRLNPAVDNVLHQHGHSSHAGDIIPPFSYTLADGATGRFPGLNWDQEGEVIWANGCVRPPPPHPEEIKVFATCVDAGASTYDATFGYQSNNTVDVKISAGPENGFSPTPLDRGQVETFHPGTVNSAFSVTAIPIGTELTWTVSYAGHSSSATVNATFGVSCTRPPPPPIGVFVRCVTNHGATYDASFGYQNDGTSAVSIPVGASNRFEPAPEDRGQTTTFVPGNVQDAFTVKGIPTSDDLVWSLTTDRTQTATATAGDETKCSEPPPPATPIGVFVTCVVDHGATYDAVFGYQNDNLVAQLVPLGLGNMFSPGPADRRQPALFAPGRLEEAVGVKGIPASVALTWTLAFKGTRSATATAAFPTKCDEPVEPPETGGPETPEPPGPKPPDPPGPRPPEPPRPLGIFASCVVNHGRTYDAVFGYVNENVGDVVVPVGPHNAVSPGPRDQGQPQTFRPGFVDASFTVRGVSATKKITWKVSFGGQTRVATASAAFTRCLTAPITPVADVALSKSAAPGSVVIGEPVTFTLTLRNPASKVVGPFEVTDVVPRPQLHVVGARAHGVRCRTSVTSGAANVTCSVRTLAPGASLTIRIAARSSAPGSATDHAAIRGVPHDAAPHNNVAAATVTVVLPPPPPSSGLG